MTLQVPHPQGFQHLNTECRLKLSLTDYPKLVITAEYITFTIEAANINIHMVELQDMMQRTIDEFVAKHIPSASTPTLGSNT